MEENLQWGLEVDLANLTTRNDTHYICVFYLKKFDMLRLVRLVVDKKLQRQGIGTELMTELCRIADKYKLTVAMTHTDELGSNYRRLIGFYKRFNFIANKGKDKNYNTMHAFIRKHNGQ